VAGGGGDATGDFGSSNSPAGSADSGHSSDSDKPVVFHNMGAPADKKDNDGPWDGPDPAESPHAQQSQEHQVGEEDKKPAKTTMTPEHIVNQVGDKSALTVSKDNITAMVGGNGGMSPEMLKGLMGPIAAMIVGMVGNKVSTQQVSSMTSATVAAMAASLGGRFGAPLSGMKIIWMRMSPLSSPIRWAVRSTTPCWRI
jgi:hypothetical protein